MLFFFCYLLFDKKITNSQKWKKCVWYVPINCSNLINSTPKLKLNFPFPNQGINLTNVFSKISTQRGLLLFWVISCLTFNLFKISPSCLGIWQFFISFISIVWIFSWIASWTISELWSSQWRTSETQRRTTRKSTTATTTKSSTGKYYN